jgi:hypothetical protein
MKKRLIIALLAFTACNVNAQIYLEDKAVKDIQNIQLNKPEIGKLNDFIISDDKVNLSTGVASPNVLLTELRSRSLSNPVVLLYKSGKGVRVNDISNDIGLGWDIESGGSITRKVNGFADDISIYIGATVGVEATNPLFIPNNPKFINGWLDYANWAPKTNPQIQYIFPAKPLNNESLGGAV